MHLWTAVAGVSSLAVLLLAVATTTVRQALGLRRDGHKGARRAISDLMLFKSFYVVYTDAV